jgi:hypothetical protein
MIFSHREHRVHREIQLSNHRVPAPDPSSLWPVLLLDARCNRGVGVWRSEKGDIEHYHRTVKSRCISPITPLSIETARRSVARFFTHYNTTRLNSAIGYVTPLDMLEGRQTSILEARDRKREEARLLGRDRPRQQQLDTPNKLPARPRTPGVDLTIRQRDWAPREAPPIA